MSISMWKSWLLPTLAAAASLSFTGLGLLGALTRRSPSQLPHLFLGVAVLGVLGFLLTIPMLLDVVRSKKRHQEGEEERRIEINAGCRIWPPPWSRTVASLCQELGVQPSRGLTTSEAVARMKEHGSNRIEVLDMPGYFSFVVKEMYEPTQLLLLCVGILYVMFGSLEEGATAFVVIFLMIAAEVGTEWRAKQALASLKISVPRDALVRRDYQVLRVPASYLVPGDIVHLEAGMEVPADVRILQSHSFEVDESKMTGESTPVSKNALMLYPSEVSLLERTNIAMAGSRVSRGKAVGLVYQTGVLTALGQVLLLARKVKDKKTKLQKVMKEVAWILTMVALAASAVGALLGLLKHMRWQDVLLSGLSLAFATIPEELPILIAAVLAVGGQKLSLKGMYVKHLRAAENLGFVDTVLTDKTGTLTENQLLLYSGHVATGVLSVDEMKKGGFVMTDRHNSSDFAPLFVAWLFMSEIGEELKDEGQDIEITGTLAKEQEPGPFTEPQVDDVHLEVLPLTGSIDLTATEGPASSTVGNVSSVLGDVFDHAVLAGLGARLQQGQSRFKCAITAEDTHIQQHLRSIHSVREGAKLLLESPFDPTLKFASRIFQIHTAELKMFVKGAPELLLKHCSFLLQDGCTVPVGAFRKLLEDQVSEAASRGLRLIGYAHKDLPSAEEFTTSSNEDGGSYAVLKGTVFLGFLGFQDPVKYGVAKAVKTCQEAGVRVIMVTGDHVKTALAVATSIGILSAQEYEANCNTGAVSCTDIQLVGMVAEDTRILLDTTSVFARATAADKLTILEALQVSKKCVLVTGDGINDAPILSKADVGVAMGKGTDVAREAASIVIVDDNFAMVPYALAEGRRLLDNLRKALAFYLGVKLGLICLFIVGTLWQSFPLSAIQIIVLELFMDLGASTSFVMESADSDIMRRQPRHHSQQFFDAQMMGGILVSAASIIFVVLSSFSYGIYHNPNTGQTSAFLAWLFSHVLLAINMRTICEPLLKKGPFSNVGMLIWLLAAASLGVLIAVLGSVRMYLKLVPLPLHQWLVIIAFSVVGTFWVELVKILKHLMISQTADFQVGEKQDEEMQLLAS
ncbi:hypothetical protein CY35_02G096300 [Sphagnum magellanicum]|nr:hypothetical protein CY35_02G096300 [Sphagnum magellanicum]